MTKRVEPTQEALRLADRYGIEEPLSAHHRRIETRKDWLGEMCQRHGIVPAPEAENGLAVLARFLLPDLFWCRRTFFNYRHHGRGEEAYQGLEDVGLIDLDDVHQFNLGICTYHGNGRSRIQRSYLPILVDKRGRGSPDRDWRNPVLAVKRVLRHFPWRTIVCEYPEITRPDRNSRRGLNMKKPSKKARAMMRVGVEE